MTTTHLFFRVNKDDILNSNSLAGLHWAVKGKRVEKLRLMAVEKGVALHKEENLDSVNEWLNYLNRNAELAIQKSRFRKQLIKKGELSKKEMDAAMIEEFLSEEPVEPEVKPDFLFHKFTTVVHVMPPTKRRLDPVNLYPTIKPIIDGLTDASCWGDDSFEYLKEISFRYGGLSSEKGHFEFVLTIQEIPSDRLNDYENFNFPDFDALREE